MASSDKLLQVYFTGLKILETALQEPVCGGDIPGKEINKQIKPFVKLLVNKIAEMNFRARDISMGALLLIFRHPSIDIRFAIEGVMDITEKPPGPAKENWRHVAARLEILQTLVMEFGIHDEIWNWEVVYDKLIAPSFLHTN